MVNVIKADSDQLRMYAKRIRNVNERIRVLANQINVMKYSVDTTMQEKTISVKLGNLHNYRERLELCENYLMICADEIDATVGILLKQNILEFVETKNKNSFLGIESILAVSKEEKEKIIDSLIKAVGVINPNIEDELELYRKLSVALNDPIEGSQIVYKEAVDILDEYLKCSLPGTLNKLGIACFINMVSDTPKKILEGTNKYFSNSSSITDIKVWANYFGYLGEEIVVDNILETAEGTIDYFTDKAENILKYFGVDVDLSISNYYEKTYGVGGIEGYKKGMGEAAEMLYGVAEEAYDVTINSVLDSIGSGCKILQDGVSQWNQIMQNIF